MSRVEMDRTSEYLAIQSYYTGVAELAARAIKRNTVVPEVPPLSELSVVDGWVVRNGRPLWSVRDQKFTDAQLGWSGLSIQAARSAWRAATEYRLQAGSRLFEEAAERVRRGNKSPEAKARLLAEIGFYSSLLEEHRRAIHGRAPMPVVPEASELEFVNGWLMWKGQPVWWSGQRASEASPAVTSEPADVSAGAGAPTRERPRLRRLLALPWRRAAA